MPDEEEASRRRNICLLSVNKQFYREALAVRQASASVVLDSRRYRNPDARNGNDLMSMILDEQPETITPKVRLAQSCCDNVMGYQGLTLYIALADDADQNYLIHTLTKLFFQLDERVERGAPALKSLRFVLEENYSIPFLHGRQHPYPLQYERQTDIEQLLRLLITDRPAFHNAQFCRMKGSDQYEFRRRCLDSSGWMDHSTFAQKMLEYHNDAVRGLKLK